MTVSSIPPRIDYIGTGAVATFPIPFELCAASDLVVHVGGVRQTLGVHYNVEGSFPGAGGNAVFVTGHIPASGVRVIFEGATPITQPVDLGARERFYEDTVEGMDDRNTILIKQLNQRALQLPVGSPDLPEQVVTDLFTARDEAAASAADASQSARDAAASAAEAEQSAHNASQSAQDAAASAADAAQSAGEAAASAAEAGDARDEAVGARNEVVAIVGDGVPVPLMWKGLADGTQAEYELSGLTSGDPATLLVTLDGVEQAWETDYTIALSPQPRVIFTDTPPAGTEIHIRTMVKLSQWPVNDPLYYDDGNTLSISVPPAGEATAMEDGTLGLAVYAADSDTTSRNKAATPAGVAAQIAAGGGNGAVDALNVWVSPECSMGTKTTMTSCNHNLNLLNPKRVYADVLLVCHTPVLGYAAGDVAAQFSSIARDTSFNYTMTISAQPRLTENTISIVSGLNTFVIDLSTPSSSFVMEIIDLPDWRYVFRIFYRDSDIA